MRISPQACNQAGRLTWRAIGDPAAAAGRWVRELGCLAAADAVVFDCPDHPGDALTAAAAHPTTALRKPPGQVWVLFCAESAVRFPVRRPAPVTTALN